MTETPLSDAVQECFFCGKPLYVVRLLFLPAQSSVPCSVCRDCKEHLGIETNTLDLAMGYEGKE